MPNSAALCPLPPPRPTRRKTRHPPPGRRPFSQSSSVSLCLRGEILHHARPRANYDAHRCQTVRLCVLCHLCAPPEGRRVTHRPAGGHSRSHPPYRCASVVISSWFPPLGVLPRQTRHRPPPHTLAREPIHPRRPRLRRHPHRLARLPVVPLIE